MIPNSLAISFFFFPTGCFTTVSMSSGAEFAVFDLTSLRKTVLPCVLVHIRILALSYMENHVIRIRLPKNILYGLVYDFGRGK